MDLFLANRAECNLAAHASDRLKELGINRVVTPSLDGALILRSLRLWEVIHLVKELPPSLSEEVVMWSDHSARVLDREVVTHYRKILGYECALGWEYQDKYLFGFTAKYIYEVSRLLNLDNFSKTVVMIDYSQSEYVSSQLMPNLIWVNCFINNGHTVKLLKFKFFKFTWDVSFPDIDPRFQHSKKLCSFPGAFYDRSLLMNKFKSDKDCIDIQSPQIDVSVADNRLLFVDAPPAWTYKESKEKLTSSLSELFQEYWKGLQVGDIRLHPKQIDAWIKRVFFQIHAADKIDSLMSHMKITDVYMTETCGGLHGPLLTAIRKHKVNTEVIPHSTIVKTPMDRSDIRLLGPVHRVDNGFYQLGLRDRSRKSRHRPKPLRQGLIKRVGLLMNEFDSFSGISRVKLESILEFIRGMCIELEARNVLVSIRAKPGHILFMDYLTDCNIMICDQDSLLDFLDSTDFAISLVQPTSSLIEAWKLGLPTAHIQNFDASFLDKAFFPLSGFKLFDTGYTGETTYNLINFMDTFGTSVE